jgi:hypothetical protein
VEVALLDQEGIIVGVNDAWAEFCEANGGDLSRAGVGMSYLDLCPAGIDSTSDEIRAAILLALDGDLPSPLSISLSCHTPQEDRWFDVLISSRVDDNGVTIGACVTLSESESPSGRDRIARYLQDLVVTRGYGSGIMHLCDIAAEVSGVTGAAITLLAGELARGSLCTTDGVAAYLDDLQYALGEGPSLDANRVGRAMMEPELGSATVDRWPVFTPSAIRAGARAVFALPIRVGAQRIGSLTLYRDQPGPLVAEHYTDALVVADIAARTILSLQAEAPPGSVAVELEDGANFHFIVHQAAGMLSAQLEIGVTEALAKLRSHAALSDTPIDRVAESVVSGRLRFRESEST